MKADYFDRGDREEWWNALTHSIPAGAMLCLALLHKNPSVVIYAASMCLTFLFSMLYHAQTNIVSKEFFRRLDMSSIFLSIGVTGMVYLNFAGSQLWLTSLVLGMSLMMLCVAFYGELVDRIMVPMALVFSNAIILIFFLSISSLRESFYFYLGNGFYIVGLFYYLRDSRRWYHTVWHICVAVASFVHLVHFL